MLEWHGSVNCNGVQMKLDFTNGSVTAYGVAPATFTTKDELTQHIIENSEQFKSGRIRVERVVPLPEEKPMEKLPEANTEPAGGEPQADADEAGEGVPLAIDVADKMEAIEYLKEHFPEKGYTAVKLRTKTAFEAACKECGVAFRYPLN